MVRAGLDLIPHPYADPAVKKPSTSTLMAMRAASKGDGNLWAKDIHYPHKDLFVPADFPTSDHRYTVWALKNGNHLMAAEWGNQHQYVYKVVLLEEGFTVENIIVDDDLGGHPCPTINACLAPPGLVQDAPASWMDEATICSS